MRIRSYSELSQISTFEERYEYLALRGEVGAVTFGYDRYLNQRFYTSAQWRHVRDQVLVRDYGLDLAFMGYEILSKPVIHHMNPMTPEDLIGGEGSVLDPEFLITTTHTTHNAIHYGDKRLLVSNTPVERRPGDTAPWRL